MKMLKTKLAILPNFKLSAAFAIFSLIVGCVTVNVNFPESAVQKASDDYVRDLYRTKEQGKSSVPKSSATPAGVSVESIASPLPNANLPSGLFISSALADDLQLNMSSPKIAAIKAKMKAAVPDVIEQKKAGVLGETNDGRIVIHDASKLKPLLKQKVESLVRDDNASRDSLYTEVVNSNHLPAGSNDSVRKIFARSFQSESPSGTWIQGENGSWAQKQ